MNRQHAISRQEELILKKKEEIERKKSEGQQSEDIKKEQSCSRSIVPRHTSKMTASMSRNKALLRSG